MATRKRGLDQFLDELKDEYGLEYDGPSPKRQRVDNHNNNVNNDGIHGNDDACTEDEEEANKKLLVGVLSPRMLYRLRLCAEFAYHLCSEEESRFTNFTAEYDFDAFMSDYLPVRFRKKIFKSFWMGYCQIFKAMAEILKRKEEPDVAAVTRELMGYGYDQRYNSFYKSKGGLIEYGIDAVIKRSEEESVPYPQGDESFFEVPEFKKKHDALPEMPDYDFEYDMVWETLCESRCMVFELNSGGPWPSDEENEDHPDEDFGVWYQRQIAKTLDKLRRQP